jgi:hypothetical protein
MLDGPSCVVIVLVCDRKSMVWEPSARLGILIIETLLRLWCNRHVRRSAVIRFLIQVTIITSGGADDEDAASNLI